MKICKLRGGVVHTLVNTMFHPIFSLFYRQNIWRIYDLYRSRPTQLRKTVWNIYMERHSASISIDAQFASRPILPHGVSGIFITQSATLGENVVIFQQVTIGANTIKGSQTYGAPVIGDNVYIGAGAKIIGKVSVGDNARIGANAVIVKNIPVNALAIVGETRIVIREEKQDNSFHPYLEKS